MISLFLLTIAGIAARLKPTVTHLLQAPLQGLRAPARVGDTIASTPPHALRPLRTGAGCLLLSLCLLTLLALPMQTAAHTLTGEYVYNRVGNILDTSNHRYYSKVTGHSSPGSPSIPFGEIIQWIRVYKNPKTIPVDTLSNPGTAADNVRSFLGFSNPVPIYDFSAHGLQAVTLGYLLPSYEGEEVVDYWVPFHGETGELFEDETKPGQSGQVTATENTAVGTGDIVAIAVNIKSWTLGICGADMAIGPTVTRTVPFTYIGTTYQIAREEGKWRLNPNMPLWQALPQGGGRYGIGAWPTAQRSHTFVYQFRVTEAHLALNAIGTWIKQVFVTEGERFGYNNGNSNPDDDLDDARVTHRTAVDWIWDEGDDRPWDKGQKPWEVLPTASTVSPFNTFGLIDRYKLEWGIQPSTSWGYTGAVQAAQLGNDPWNVVEQVDGANHRHIPMFDPANPPDPETGGPIYYPKVEAPGSRATTTMDVPGGTQTGAFTVTLHFRDGAVFEGYNLSPTGLESFKTALTAAFADAPANTRWKVEALAVEDEKRPRIASSGVAGPTSPSVSTEYQLTLVPPKGVKGEVSLTIPENVVMDAGDNGNLALAEPVMISVDTSLEELLLAEGKAVEIPKPKGGAYLAGDAIEVRVPFAQDGLTYEGDAPYLVIYLGAGTENPRHATWQQGEESAGSTIVPFKYVIAATDPIVSSVRVDTDAGVLRPVGTTLMNGDGQVWVVGTAAPAMGSGEKAPAPAPSDTNKVSLATSTGETVTPPEAEVQVLPAVYLPPTEESAPKAGMSSIPRSPIVFNELGNGSGDTNDWLELRNVTGDAVSLKDWELSVVQDGKKEDTSLVIFPDVSVPAEGLLLLTNSDPTAEGNLLSGGDDIATAKAEVKGSSHLYLVNAGLSLPDDGKFLLILRNAKEKRGLNEAFVDVAGGGGSGTDAFVREQEGDYDTYVWPLQVLEAPGDATEDALSSGKVWLRAKADIVGYHRDAWAEAAFTGVGYDRKVSKSAETAGTPGYPNGAVKTEAPTPKGAITISEVMLDSAGGTLPQWVELYNASKTDALNLNRWELEIQNVDSEDLVGRPIVRLTLQEKIIQPNQTLLIVTGTARASSADVYPADRVYNLQELHDKNLRIKKPSDTFLSAKGFYLRLTDRNEHLVDEVGNTDGNRRTDDNPAWALPVPLSELEGMRSSLVRRYDNGVARDGKEKSSWALAANFAKFKAAELHYGHADDIGTPGYRQGGALPVELSSFTVTRVASGSVIVTWTTESEVDNAGFNLRRSLTRDGGFTLLNPALIAGAGTTGERQTYTYIDTSAKPGVEHYYQIEEVSFGGKAETLVTRRLRGPVSPAHRALKTLGEVKQLDE